MNNIPQAQLLERIRVENPWWEGAQQTDEVYREMRPRASLKAFFELVESTHVRRAVVLMGPRRVGKTVLLQHTIQELLKNGIPARNITCLSLDQPLYSNLSIEELISLVRNAVEQKNTAPAFLFLDEIQYLKDWERHLKVFVDTHPHIKCVVSGSAAAALRLSSIESGAGRFTDFFLPPLTFHEYLGLQGITPADFAQEGERPKWGDATVAELNRHFVRYINMGGYPEVIFSETIQQNVDRYVRSDIIDKVLLRDLPGLYGIQDSRELNSLFMALAWNTAQEVSLDGLSQRSGVSKPTLKRYIEYLEAAFLIKTVHRVDQNARRFKRINFFKVYLTNPSIHCALFGPPQDGEPSGALVETAVFAQLFHHRNMALHYARWRGGEVDFVSLDELGRPVWCLEVKWSDRNLEQVSKQGPLRTFLRKHPRMSGCCFTTRTRSGKFAVADQEVRYLPASVYSYVAGRRTRQDFTL